MQLVTGCLQLKEESGSFSTLSLSQIGPRIRYKLPLSEITVALIPLILPSYAEFGKVEPKSWVKIDYMTMTIYIRTITKSN